MSTVASTLDELVTVLQAAGVAAGDPVAVAVAGGVGIGLATTTAQWLLAADDPAKIVAHIDEVIRPRWVWWSKQTPATLLAAGVRPALSWDVAAVHRLLDGGWRDDPARVWASLNGLEASTLPVIGQLDLLSAHEEEGDAEEPIRPDGHLRPDWIGGGWSASVERLGRWAAVAADAQARQSDRIASLAIPAMAGTARSESAAESLCAELAADGLPFDVGRAEEIIAGYVGPRPRSEAQAGENRARRDEQVLRHAPAGWVADLRNPGQVKSLLRGVGVDVSDTRAWRLEPFRATHPFVDALLTWRKAERIETTFGYAWLDANVSADGRLRGAWHGSDGAAGRMTAQAGLHNMPAEMRPAVLSKPGFMFVHADLGQIEPRVLAAVSGDRALSHAAQEHDMYSPVAARLGVERSVAKVAVLAAMYGQTSGAAGQALQGMEAAYPVAMKYLRDADDAGRAGRDIRTFGGRLVRMWQFAEVDDTEARDERSERAATAARGRFARNAIVQGAAAELFKAWAATVRARIAPSGARIVLCLHDELLVHVPVDQAEAVARHLEACLQEAATRWSGGIPVRFVADAAVVQRWSDAKG